MNRDFYTLNSIPRPEDFARWPLWCCWDDPSELDELPFSQIEIEKLFLEPNSNNEEVYYPIIQSSLQIDREFLYAKARILLTGLDDSDAYISLVQNEVISATVFLPIQDLDFLKHDRMVAKEVNHAAIATVRKITGLDEFHELRFIASIDGTDGKPFCGTLKLFSDFG